MQDCLYCQMANKSTHRMRYGIKSKSITFTISFGNVYIKQRINIYNPPPPPPFFFFFFFLTCIVHTMIKHWNISQNDYIWQEKNKKEKREKKKGRRDLNTPQCRHLSSPTVITHACACTLQCLRKRTQFIKEQLENVTWQSFICNIEFCWWRCCGKGGVEKVVHWVLRLEVTVSGSEDVRIQKPTVE